MKLVRNPGRCAPERKQRLVRLVRAIAASGLLLILASGAYLYIGPIREARARLRDAQLQYSIARAQLATSPDLVTVDGLARVRAAVVRAHGDLAAVDSLTVQYSPILDLAEWVPGLGMRVHASRQLLTVAMDAATTADLACQSGQAFLQAESGPGRSQAAHLLLRTLVAQRATLELALTDLRQAEAIAHGLPAGAGLGHDADQLLGAFRREAGPGEQALSALIGLAGLTQHGAQILLVSQNPDEQRATGGFIGFAGLAHLSQSGLTIDHYMTSSAVDQQYIIRIPSGPNSMEVAARIRPPLAAQFYAGWQNWLFRDGNWYADFPSSARQLEYFYGRGQGIAPDGVIAIEPALLVRLLALTGPITLPGHAETLSSTNALAVLHQAEYVRGDKAFTLDAWQALTARVLTLPSNQALPLARSLVDALKARDVLIYVNDHRLQDLLQEAGLTASVAQTPGDYLYVVDSNLGFNKLDPYLRRSVAYNVRIQPTGLLDCTVVLTYTNTWPAGRLLAPFAGLGQTTYVDYLRVLAPAGARLVSAAGWEGWAPSTESGRALFSGGLFVGAGQTVTVTLRYREPAYSGAAGTYRLHVQAQPGGYAPLVRTCLSGLVPGGQLRCRPATAGDFDWVPGS